MVEILCNSLRNPTNEYNGNLHHPNLNINDQYFQFKLTTLIIKTAALQVHTTQYIIIIPSLKINEAIKVIKRNFHTQLPKYLIVKE